MDDEVSNVLTTSHRDLMIVMKSTCPINRCDILVPRTILYAKYCTLLQKSICKLLLNFVHYYVVLSVLYIDIHIYLCHKG